MRRLKPKYRPAISAVMAVALLLATPSSVRAQDVVAVAKPKQYVYVLRLVPRVHDDAAWTETDKAAVSQHFQRRQQATVAGRVILAGRTTEPGDKTFGLVIFEALDDAAAQQFMESDPAVVAGVMTSEHNPLIRHRKAGWASLGWRVNRPRFT